MTQAFHARAVLMLGLAAFTSAAATRAVDPLLVPIAEEFGTTAGGASIAATAFLASYGFLQFFHGPLGDRVGKYRAQFYYTLVSAVTMFLCAAMPTLETLAFVRFVAGATVGGMITLALAWIGDTVPYERRQTVLARFMTGQLLGVGCGGAAAGMVAQQFGWRAVFVVLGSAMLAVAFGLWWELRSQASAAKPGERSFGADVRGVFGLLRRPWVQVITASVFTEGLCMYGALAFVPLHLHATQGLSVGESGAAILLFAAGGLCYALLSHILVPRLKERGLAKLGGACMSLGVALVALAPLPAAAFLGLFLCGVGFYSFHNTLQTNATQMAPDARGSGISLFAFCMFGGSSLGVFAGGFAVDTFGTRPVLAAFSLGIAGLAVYFARRLGSRPSIA